MRRLVASLAFFAASWASAQSLEPPSTPASPAPAQLSRGVYKFGGRCAKLTVFGIDKSADCGTFLGVIATDPARPVFILPTEQGQSTWQVHVGSPGVLSPSGDSVTYEVASVLDLKARLEFRDPGVCVMSVKRGEPLLVCTTWSDESHQHVRREITFEGNGQMAFDRGDRKPAASGVPHGQP